MRFNLIICLFFSATVVAQKDSIQEIDAVHVSFTPGLELKKTTLKEQQIQEMAPEDAGDLIRKFAGVSLKSYGGLGGLKTVSMRGLGANHSTIVSDGFALTNNQTGQVNLGQIQASNVTNFISVIGSSASFLQPISAQIAGSSFILETFENSFGSSKIQIRANAKYGSFNQKNGYLGVKYHPSKFFISLTGNYRDADGNYPYSYQNGSIDVNEKRKNNDYQDYSFGATVGYKNDKVTVRMGYSKLNISQGLPGAVIFYNQTQDERLKTNKDRLFNDVVYKKKQFKLRWYSSASQSTINYLDPTYLNTVGKIDVDYKNRNATFGLSINQSFGEKWEMFGGTEEILSDLKTNDTTFALPVRFHNFSLLGTRYKLSNFKIEFSLSSQYITERNNNGDNAKDRFRLNPFLSLSMYGMKKNLMIEAWYRNSFRMPTFNELYYNNIGNNLLEPEDADQYNIGVAYRKKYRKLNWEVKANGFYNLVDNKIVAIPTKNLFVWSMQNIGKTRIIGGELILTGKWQFHPNWKLAIDGNYTLQQTIDITDKESPTYGDQVAYIPLQTGNVDVAVYFKETGLRFSSNFVSERFALNENVEANKIDGFYIADISIFHRFKIKKSNTLQVQFNVKNVLNRSYAYIRSYEMPGINYLISITYAFN